MTDNLMNVHYKRINWLIYITFKDQGNHALINKRFNLPVNWCLYAGAPSPLIQAVESVNV